MKPTPWQRLDGLARRLTPFGWTIVLLLVSLVPTHVPGFARIVPMLALMSVYHWAIHRPDLLPPLAAFLAGVLHDFLAGLPVGVTAVVFLAAHAVLASQRRFFLGKSFAVMWLGFILVAAGAAAASWCLVSIYYMRMVDPNALAYQFLITIGCFPLVAWVLMRWQNAFLRQD